MKFLIRFALRFIPRKYLHYLSVFLLKILSPFYRGNKYEDPITGIKYRKLLPYGRVKFRKNALAPDSLSLERHRLIWLYLKEKTDFFNKNYKLLHIAPEFCFLKKFKKLNNLEYLTADLESPWADIKMDIKKMPFDDNSFDIVFCNHVLEHIDDDKKAMKEIFRVLKPGAWAILQVPIDYNRERTYENTNIISPKEREKHFLQADHYRIYGKDYPERLKEAGFIVKEDDFVKKLEKEKIKYYCLNPNEILYICIKPTNNNL